MKKKKKKKTVKDGDDLAEKIAALELEKEGGAEGQEAAPEEKEEQTGDMEKGTGIWEHDETKPIMYELLLNRFFNLLAQKNPDHASSGAKSYKIPPPQCMREGNKKTIFANIAEICKRMKRSDEHVTAYLFAELGTNGSVDGSRRLVIKGRFQQKQIENVLRKYISALFPLEMPARKILTLLSQSSTLRARRADRPTRSSTRARTACTSSTATRAVRAGPLLPSRRVSLPRSANVGRCGCRVKHRLSFMGCVGSGGGPCKSLPCTAYRCTVTGTVISTARVDVMLEIKRPCTFAPSPKAPSLQPCGVPEGGVKGQHSSEAIRVTSAHRRGPYFSDL